MKRRILQLLAVVLATGCVSALAQAPIPTADANKRGLTDKDFPKVVKLGDNVYGIQILPAQGPNAQPNATRVTTNSMAVITTDGVLVADTQGSIAAANQVMDEIKKLTSQPIKYVVVCSEHTDHTNGISAFPSTATYISSPFSQKTFQDQANAPNRPPNAPRVVVPSETVDDKRVLKMGSTEIQILKLGRSHTGGDIVVYLPKERVLWMSETFNSNRFPTLRTGYASEWVQAIDKAQHMDVQVLRRRPRLHRRRSHDEEQSCGIPEGARGPHRRGQTSAPARRQRGRSVQAGELRSVRLMDRFRRAGPDVVQASLGRARRETTVAAVDRGIYLMAGGRP